MIFGLDFLIANKFDFILSDETVRWQGVEIDIYNNDLSSQQKDCNVIDKGMSDNVYERHTGESVAAHKNAAHLDSEERVKLANVIKTFEDIIQGKAGDFNGSEVEFQLKPNAVPYCARPYRIPHAHIELMKRAIKEMERNGVIEEYSGNSEWAAPTFGVPKKNKGIRIVSDFRKLNEMLKRSPWPMPTIMDMMHQCGGMTFATALDMIMSYYAMRIRQDLQKYLGIVLP